MTKPTTDERLAELREQVANDMADAVVPGLLARLDQAEEERDDWRDGARKVLAEKCPTDEKHCSCVPVLRKRVRELEKELSVTQSWATARVATLESQLSERWKAK